MCVAVVASYRRYRSSHWLYDNPQRFEDQNILNVPNANILYTGTLVPWLVTFLKPTEQGYLDGPGFGCTSPASVTAEVVGRNLVRWSAAQLSNESALPRTTDSTP